MSAQEWPGMDKRLRLAKFHWSPTIHWVNDALALSKKDKRPVNLANLAG